MNPLKIKKIQLGSSVSHPNITSTDSKLNFYDSTVGSIRLDQLLGERYLPNVSTVSKNALGSDFTTIQSSIDSAVTGGVIVIYGGTYEETLTITNKDLNLICIGSVSLESTDTTPITITSSSVSISDMTIKIKNGVGNPIPYCVETTHTATDKSLTLKFCTLNTSEHVNAKAIKSTKVAFYSYDCDYLGLGDIEITGSSKNHFLGAVFPDISLSGVLSDSHIVGDVLDLGLISSGVSLSGSFVSCVGDANSTIKKSMIRGSVVFDNTDTANVTLDCPLATDSYTISIQNLSSGQNPIISNRLTTGFTLTSAVAMSETVYFTLFQ